MPDEKENLSLLQGSKYIPSITADAIKSLVPMAKEHKILFFGTPCQAAAADKLLRKKGLRDQALIVDLICHGVPSYHLWDKYLAELNCHHKVGDHPAVLFRSKEQEWRKLLLVASGNGHTYKELEQKDDFYAFFRRGLCYMESCSDCPYRERSAADIRIGDYWGQRFSHDKQGVSMVIANSIRGNNILKEVFNSQLCHAQKQELSEYWSVQYPYNPQRPLIREQLIQELADDSTSLHTLRKKYCRYYDSKERVGKAMKLAKKLVKKVVKRG